MNDQSNHQGKETHRLWAIVYGPYKIIHVTTFRYVYAPYHHKMGNMNEVEWETYQNLVDFFLTEPKYQLDGIIYESVLNQSP